MEENYKFVDDQPAPSHGQTAPSQVDGQPLPGHVDLGGYHTDGLTHPPTTFPNQNSSKLNADMTKQSPSSNFPRTPRIPVRKINLKKPTEHCTQKPDKVKEKIKMIERKIEKKLPTPNKKPPKMKILTREKIRKFKMKNSGSQDKKLNPKNITGINPTRKIDL
jgi:hypothetical protein